MHVPHGQGDWDSRNDQISTSAYLKLGVVVPADTSECNGVSKQVDAGDAVSNDRPRDGDEHPVLDDTCGAERTEGP